MIVRSDDANYGTLIGIDTTGDQSGSWEFDGTDYSGVVYSDGESAKIWATWVNRRYTVFGFHVEPGNLFGLAGLDVWGSAVVSNAGDGYNFDCSRLPSCRDFAGDCDTGAAEECVKRFLNGGHPASPDYDDVGFAFHSPYQCQYKYDEQPIGSTVKVSLSLWLDARLDECNFYDYGVHGRNDPNQGCECDDIYVEDTSQSPITMTRLDEDHWLLQVDRVDAGDLDATDCAVVPINKKRDRTIRVYPMDYGSAGPFSFRILFFRETVSQ